MYLLLLLLVIIISILNLKENNMQQVGGNNELNIINLFINNSKKLNIPCKRKKRTYILI